MRYRAFSIAAVSLALVMGSATAATAGGDKTSNAPQLVVGQSYAGTTYVGGKEVTDIWRLPGLLLSDAVVIAAVNDSRPDYQYGYQYMCLAGNVDDYSWYANQCNLAERESFNGYGTRVILYANANASNAFLQVRPWHEGAYHFTLEAIRHKVMTNITVPSSTEATLSVPLTAAYTNSTPVVNKIFTLTATWTNGGTWSTAATTDAAGNATFAVSLPAAAQGKTVSFVATAPESATDQAAASPAATSAVKAPPAPAPTPTPTVKYPTVRIWTYSNAKKLEVDVDPNAGFEWKVRLQKLKNNVWVNASKKKTTKSTHRKFNPKKGTYRVVVYAKNGYSTTATTSVWIRK